MSEEEAEKTAPQDGAAAPAEGEAQPEGKFNAKKIILFVVVPLVLLLGIGGGLYFTGMLDGLLGKKEAAEGEHGEAGDGHGGGHEKEDAHGGGHGEGDGHGGGIGAAFLEIPTMIVNLNTEDDGIQRYLRLSVQLELANAADRGAVEAVIPRVIDQFQTYLRELRVRDLRGSAGIYRLQMELLWRVNQAAAPVEVKDVLFQEILIQ